MREHLITMRPLLDLPNKEISLDLGEKGSYDIYKVDSGHNGELVAVTDNLSFELELYSMVLIKEK